MKHKIEYLDTMEVEEIADLSETLVKVNRSAAVVKGGRRFSFSALSIVGNRDGLVGFGFGKARQVPYAIEKAAKDGRKHLQRVHVAEGGTIPHEITGRFCGAMIRLLPASPGTGIIACSSVRAVCEMAGIKNILTKSYGSTNPINLVKATLAALAQLRTSEQLSALRGVPINR
ncbi:MAG: 30S ribosomal protein S5 [Planctomycetes bacterium]|jgi:small subunit ribosomal protein S5|nr:30S ribosomal protein S5 [Planctomycetota bacterium]MDP6410324.1 30S ribosomal protein S5 [Planctomycetota bacterium]